MDTQLFLSNNDATVGMVRAAMEPATQSSTFGIVLGLIVVVAVFAIIVSVMSWIAKSAKSKEYRTLISDMFVAGKVRQIADEEKVDLDTEMKRFRRWQKKDYLKGTELDAAIAVNLRDKITERAEAEIDKIDNLDTVEKAK